MLIGVVGALVVVAVVVVVVMKLRSPPKEKKPPTPKPKIHHTPLHSNGDDCQVRRKGRVEESGLGNNMFCSLLTLNL